MACEADDQDATAAAAAVARLSLPTSPLSPAVARSCDGDGDREGEKQDAVPRSPLAVHGGSPVAHEVESVGDTGFMVDVGGSGDIPSDATTANPVLLVEGRGRSAGGRMPRLQLGELPVSDNATTQTREELVVGGGSHRASIVPRQSDAREKRSNQEELRTSLPEPDAGYCGFEAGTHFEGGAPDGNLMKLVSATAAADTRSHLPRATERSGLIASTTDVEKKERKASPGENGINKTSCVMEQNKTVARRIDPAFERGGKYSERPCGSQTSNSPSTIAESRARRATKSSRSIADSSPATNFVFRLAYASVPPPDTFSYQHRSKPTPVHNLSSEVAVAKLLVSMLPVIPVERDAEEALAVALDVLSLVGALSWADLAFRTPPASDREAEDPVRHGHEVVDDDNLFLRWSAAWPRELHTVDIVLLARAAEAYLDARWSVLRSYFQETRENHYGQYQDIGSSSHRICVHKACRLVLECAWMTRFLYRKIVSSGALDGQFRSSLPAETVAPLIKYCGRALEALPGDAISLVASGSCGKPDDADFEQTPTFLESRQNSSGDIESPLLTAPAVVGIVSSLTALLYQPAAWGEDLGWATAMLASTDFSGREGAVIPVLVRLFERLVASALTGGGHFFEPAGRAERAELESGPPSTACSLPSAGSVSTRRLQGAADALGELLVAVIQSLDGVIRRTMTLIEASRDLPSSRACRRHSEKTLYLVATAVGETKRKDEGVASDRDCRVPANTACTAAAAVPPASDDIEAPAKTDTSTSDDSLRETVVRSILREVSPVFRPEGPVLAILNAKVVAASQPNVNRADGGNTPRIPSDKCLSVSGMPAPCLSAALHLSASFFSARVKSREAAGDEKGDTRLGDFVGPIFSGFHFRRRCDSGGGDEGGGEGGGFEPKTDGDSTRPGGQEGREYEGLVRPGLKHGEDDSLRRDKEEEEEKEECLLCRLHLEALVELSLTGDPAVQEKLRERRVAQILGEKFFGDGSTTDESEGLMELSMSLLRPVENLNGGKVAAPLLSSRVVDAAPVGRDSDSVRDLAGVTGAVATSAETLRDLLTEEVIC